MLMLVQSPVTGEFPAQRASNAENVSIWWRHHVMCPTYSDYAAIKIILIAPYGDIDLGPH